MRVSPVGLGAVKLGRTAGLKHGAFRLPTDAEAADLIALAEDLGITLIDTAPAYGVSEERLGALLQGRRDRWVISTKAGEEFDGERSTFDFSGRAVRASVERSLARLRTNRLDVVLLHSDGRDVEIIERSGSVEALETLKKQGKVRAIGASTKTVEGAMLAAERMDVVMLSLNPAYPADAPALAEAARLGTGVMVKKALAGGRLEEIRTCAGIVAPVASAPGSDEPDDGVRGVVVPGSVDPVEGSLRFVFGHAGVSSVVLGTINTEHLRHNVECARRALAQG